MIIRSFTVCLVLVGLFVAAMAAARAEVAADLTLSPHETMYSPAPYPSITPDAELEQGISAANVLTNHLRYSTYLDKEAGILVNDVAVDREGNAVVVGHTASHSLTVQSALQSAWTTCVEGYPPAQIGVIMKFATGGQLLFATYFGGGCADTVNGVDVDDDGNIYVAGSTRSPQFPMANPLFSAFTGIYANSYVAKLSPDGSQLLFSTFLGEGVANDIGVSPDGSVYVGGTTSLANLPVKNAKDPSLGGISDGFVAKLKGDGSEMLYLTYLGGSNKEILEGVAVGSDNSVYLTGVTYSTDFPVVAAIDSTGDFAGVFTGFVTRLSADGQNLAFSTFLGGSQATHIYDLAVDGKDNVYVTGLTASTDISITADAYLTKSLYSGYDAFVTSLSPTGTLRYGTYFGGSDGPTYGYAIGVDSLGRASVVGQTSSQQISMTFPVQSGFQGGRDDVFVATFDDTGSALLFSTYLGTNASEESSAIAVSEDSTLFVAGITRSGAWPTTPGAYAEQMAYTITANSLASFLTVIKLPPPPLVFVHGIGGSRIRQTAPVNRELWPGVLGTGKELLSLYPSAIPEGVEISPQAIITEAVPGADLPDNDVYEPLLAYLTNELGYSPYKMDGDLARQTSAGCDVEGQRSANPNLFVFVYDWRQSNQESAQKLADFIACVHRFYPGQNVNLMAHSMGGLVARRYILNSGADHSVERLLTVASPFLGAPKLTNVMQTGDFMTAILPAALAKAIVPSLPAAAELMASRAYVDLSDLVPLGERGVDLDGDGDTQEMELYSYDKYIAIMNQVYGREGVEPGTIGDTFHSRDGQDDWRDDQSGIEYHHIVGQQSGMATIGQTVAVTKTICSYGAFNCNVVDTTEPFLVFGDGTVPVVSAERIGNGQNLNAPNARLHCFVGASEADDELVEHTGLFLNPAVRERIGQILEGSGPADSTFCPGTPASSARGTVAGPALRHYVSLFNTDVLTVTDAGGNFLAAGSNIVTTGYVPGVDVLVLGERALMVILPTVGTFSVTLPIPGPMAIEVRTGVGQAISRLTRYQDISLPSGDQVLLLLNQGSDASLRHDTNGNGLFDGVVPPSYASADPDALDISLPELTVQVQAQGQRVQVQMSAQDSGSGVQAIYFSADGIDYQVYTQTLSFDPDLTPKLYAFADDRASNRSVPQVVDLHTDQTSDKGIYLPLVTR